MFSLIHGHHLQSTFCFWSYSYPKQTKPKCFPQLLPFVFTVKYSHCVLVTGSYIFFDSPVLVKQTGPDHQHSLLFQQTQLNK